MATAESLAAEQQATQQSLAKLLAADLAAAWRVLDVARLRLSLPRYISAVTALAQQYGQASALLAADYYDTQRVLARQPGTFTATPADPAPAEKVDASVRWATRSLWTRQLQPGARAPTPEPGEPKPPTPAELRTNVQNLVAAVSQKLMLDTGRDTIMQAILADDRAVAWARVAQPDACAFCRLLCTREAAYKRETVGFAAHDNCSCLAVPVYRGQKYKPSAQVREWQRIYESSTKGLSGAKARTAFAKAITEHDAKNPPFNPAG